MERAELNKIGEELAKKFEFPPDSIRAVHLSCNLDSLKEGFKNRPGLGISFAHDICGVMSSPTCNEPRSKAGLVEVIITGKGLDYHRTRDRNIIRKIFQEDNNIIEELRRQGYSWVDHFNGIGESEGDELHVINAKSIEIHRIIPLDSTKIGNDLSDIDCHIQYQKKAKVIQQNLDWQVNH